jgi:SAM-dependent methyltransferase
MKTLDLGCGVFPRNPFNAEEVYGIDIADLKETEYFKSVDLNINPIPFPDNYFDYVTAVDFLEHVPRIIYIDGKIRNSFIEVMNEIWRVLKPEGTFLAFTPHSEHPDAAWGDPTHVNIITKGTVAYFTTNAEPLGRLYGFNGDFELVKQYEHPTIKYWLVWELRATK